MSSGIKNLGKILLIVLIVLYVIVEIFVTVCLLKYNDYRVTEFGNKSLLILKDNIDDDYKKGDLLVVTKDDGSDVTVGDRIFFYNAAENNTVNYAIVASIKEQKEDYVFKVDASSYNVYRDYYIGKKVQAFRKVGAILGFLESKWGFLLLIVLPTLIAVIYEVYIIILEIIDIKKEVANE